MMQTWLFCSFCLWRETGTWSGLGCPDRVTQLGSRGTGLDIGHGAWSSDELDPNSYHSPNRPQGSHSVLPGCYLSDEVPADLRLLVEERQDVIQQVPYQRGLIVHSWVEKSQSGPAHIQVWVLQALHELSWQKNERRVWRMAQPRHKPPPPPPWWSGSCESCRPGWMWVSMFWALYHAQQAFKVQMKMWT